MTAKVYGGCKEMLAVRRSAQTEAGAAFSISNEARGSQGVLVHLDGALIDKV